MVAEIRVKGIHFADVPSLARLRCAEGSHLDAVTAAEFTRELANELTRLGWLPATGPQLQARKQ
jgi:hypothetical protein